MCHHMDQCVSIQQIYVKDSVQKMSHLSSPNKGSFWKGVKSNGYLIFLLDQHFVFVHCREERTFGLFISDNQDISWGSGKLDVGGDEHPNTSWLEAVYNHSLIINPSQGIYVLGYPSLQGIDRVKTNTPLLMRREWYLQRRSHEPRHLLFYFVTFSIALNWAELMN